MMLLFIIFTLLLVDCDLSSLPSLSFLFEGNGYAHIEGNHGTFFPEGWIWSQSIMEDNQASFSLVLGKFNILGITPTNCILYVRRKGNNNNYQDNNNNNNNRGSVIFRTTDLDQVQYDVDGTNGCIQLNATSLIRGMRVELSIQPIGSTVSQSFQALVHVPTANGFSNTPGCRETYTAVATIRIYDSRSMNRRKRSMMMMMNDSTDIADKVNIEEYVFPLTALEYGGSFIQKLR